MRFRNFNNPKYEKHKIIQIPQSNLIITSRDESSAKNTYASYSAALHSQVLIIRAQEELNGQKVYKYHSTTTKNS